MAEIINLRRARKDKERRNRASEASANRQRFGRTKAEKKRDEDIAERARRAAEGARLDEDKSEN